MVLDTCGRKIVPGQESFGVRERPAKSTLVRACAVDILPTSAAKVSGAFGRSVDILPTNDLAARSRVAHSSCTPPPGASTAARSSKYQPIGLPRARNAPEATRLPKAYINVQLLINIVARVGLTAKISRRHPPPARTPTPRPHRLHPRPPRAVAFRITARRCWGEPAATFANRRLA